MSAKLSKKDGQLRVSYSFSTLKISPPIADLRSFTLLMMASRTASCCFSSRCIFFFYKFAMFLMIENSVYKHFLLAYNFLFTNNIDYESKPRPLCLFTTLRLHRPTKNIFIKNDKFDLTNYKCFCIYFLQ